MRALWVLIVTLSFSRYQFVWPTFLQTTDAVCEGLDRAWWFFGAMARTILPDNMSSVIKIADALNPSVVTSFLDYTHARGIFVDPARVRSPKDKPRVENQVAYVRESWWDGESFTDLADTQRSAAHWSREIAGMRVHGTTRKVPREVFEAVEKPTMLPAPAEMFDVPRWAEHAKVHPDHHVEIARALYSVPTLYRNKSVRVRADKTTVKIYFGTELIKVHPRRPPGGRSTDTNDYPAGKAMYALRSVDGLLAKAKDKGTHVGIYAERLLGGPLPWTRMRQAYALIRLCEKYGDGRVEAVCQSALAFDVVDVVRITRMLKRAATPTLPEQGDRKVVQLVLPALRAARAALPDTAHQERGGRVMARSSSSPTLNAELVVALKRLKLGRIADTLPERLVLADKQEMTFDDLLLLVLTDEITRRDNTAADTRAREARLDPQNRLEVWDKTSKVSFDKRMLAELASLRFLESHRQVVVLGPVGVGKTFVSQALGHIACRHGYHVRFTRADEMLRTLRQSRLDNSRDAEMIALTSVDLLIVDDFALEPMSKEESRDVYQLFLERTGRGSMIVTSNRDTAEWLAMFDDVLLAQSAVDRFKNAAFDFVMEGESYRPRLKPTLDADGPPPAAPSQKPRARPRRRR